MDTIVKKLQENRQVELAKRILESKGYTVTEPEKLKESKWERQDSDVMTLGEFMRSDVYREQVEEGGSIDVTALKRAFNDPSIDINSCYFYSDGDGRTEDIDRLNAYIESESTRRFGPVESEDGDVQFYKYVTEDGIVFVSTNTWGLQEYYVAP